MPTLFQLLSNKQSLIEIDWDRNAKWFKELDEIAKKGYCGEVTEFAARMYDYKKYCAVMDGLGKAGLSTEDERKDLLINIWEDLINRDSDSKFDKNNVSSDQYNELKRLFTEFNGEKENDKNVVTKIENKLDEVKKYVINEYLKNEGPTNELMNQNTAKEKLDELKKTIIDNSKDGYKFNNFFGGTKIKIGDEKIKVPRTIAKIYNEINKNAELDPIKTLQKVHDLLAKKDIQSLMGVEKKETTRNTYLAMREKFQDLAPKKTTEPEVEKTQLKTPSGRSG